MGDILKEAIAEARYVRQVAYENAKAQLTEAFDPKIQSALSSIIQTESEDNDADDEEFEADPEELEEADVLDGQLKKDDKTITPNFKEAVSDEFEDEEEVVEEEQQEKDDKEVTADFKSEGMEYEDEEDLEIESILDELDGEDDEEVEEPTFDDDTPPADAPVDVEPDDEPVEEPGDGGEGDDVVINVDQDDDEEEVEEQVQDLDVDGVQDDDEVNIEELLDSLDEEEYPGKANSEYKDSEEQNVVKKLESIRSENVKLKKKLSNYDKTVVYLQKQLAEVNLLNTKLLYTTKLFKNFKLTNNTKTKIVEQFDRTKSIREVKLVYSTLHESFKTKDGTVAKKTLKEAISGGASRATGGTKPVEEKSVLTESTEFANRMKKLAGIL